jgi:hypothetical protein
MACAPRIDYAPVNVKPIAARAAGEDTATALGGHQTAAPFPIVELGGDDITNHGESAALPFRVILMSQPRPGVAAK